MVDLGPDKILVEQQRVYTNFVRAMDDYVEPLHVAFVWHMHQPEYRSAQTGAFAMPWARLHGLKDYLDMVGRLSDYPKLGQTFNLVPSLVEQLEVYASGRFQDVYWEYTRDRADDLDPQEQAFVIERMCETAQHPRSHRLHPRLLELARKRDSLKPRGLGHGGARILRPGTERPAAVVQPGLVRHARTS